MHWLLNWLLASACVIIKVVEQGVADLVSCPFATVCRQLAQQLIDLLLFLVPRPIGSLRVFGSLR
jgi:hypothetical protein